ncbi:MAG: hypothetical protein A2020_13770 [Lentisphaerae bacterium GWF2_45_14]|nr:MAG: hypothetical protein A2020_13770 [Lentisphaerae bacterium GWF2_45_14]
MNVFLKISDEELKEKTLQKLSTDWTVSWRFVSDAQNQADPGATDIAVIDKSGNLAKIDGSAAIIFLGKTDDDMPYFSILEEADSEALSKTIRRAHSYKEISNQNTESRYSPKEKLELESIAHHLSVKVQQLVKQSEMRIALVDQMPVGVIGVDDESTVVMANPKAIELLKLENIPIWGLKSEELLSDKTVGTFIKDTEKESMELSRDGRLLEIRKSTFFLDGHFAGTILLLWEKDV